MKKALISTLLVVSAAFAPCFRIAVDGSNRAPEVARTVASPLFWHVYDELLSREIARFTSAPHQHGVSSEQQSDAIACFVFQFLVHRAFDGSLTAAEKIDISLMSIPQLLIRRTIERGFALA